MGPQTTKRDFARVSIGPQLLEDGFIGRIVQFADGSAEVQTWDDSKWRKGEARAHHIVRGTSATRSDLIARGVPEEECEGALD